MRKAQVENGVVVRVIVVDPDAVPDWCAEWPDASDDAQVGGGYADGVFSPAPQVDDPPPALTIDDYRTAIDRHVEMSARGWGYNGAEALASYVASTVPQWRAEAQAFVAWRDAVWVQALTDLEQIMNGAAAAPASAEAFIATLPVLVRPGSAPTAGQ